jgi:hypothetical protein
MMNWDQIVLKTTPQLLMLLNIYIPFVRSLYPEFNGIAHCVTEINRDTAEDAQRDHFLENSTDGEYTPYPNRVVRGSSLPRTMRCFADMTDWLR